MSSYGFHEHVANTGNQHILFAGSGFLEPGGMFSYALTPLLHILVGDLHNI